MNIERYLKQWLPGGFLSKPISLKSKKHLDFVRSLPCIVSGFPAEPHHVVTKKTQSNDYLCVPLNHAMHMELHQIGKESFESKYGLSLEDALVATLVQALSEDN